MRTIDDAPGTVTAATGGPARREKTVRVGAREIFVYAAARGGTTRPAPPAPWMPATRRRPTGVVHGEITVARSD